MNGWRRFVVAFPRVIVVVAAGSLAACGNGALSGPSSAEESGPAAIESDSDLKEGDGAVDAAVYGWGLPEGPASPESTFEDDLYLLIAAGDCDSAQAWLDGAPRPGWESGGTPMWDHLKSPRGVLLYQAAIDVCLGRIELGRQMFGRAGEHGWNGVDWTNSRGFSWDCEVYRSLVSVFDQRARSTVACRGGQPPAWPDRDIPDDPRTPEVESTPSGEGQVEQPTNHQPTTEQSATGEVAAEPHTDGPFTEPADG